MHRTKFLNSGVFSHSTVGMEPDSNAVNTRRQSFFKALNLIILLMMIGFTPATFAGPIVLDSLRVDYVGGSYLEVIFDSTTIYEQGDHVLLKAYFDPTDGQVHRTFSDTIVSSTLYSGYNRLALTLITRPWPFFELEVDESGGAWINFVLYGLTPANSKQVFGPGNTKYMDADAWMNERLGCDLETGCQITTDGYVLSVSPAPSEFTLTYEAGDNGSIIGVSPQTVAFGANGSPVTADPDPNFRFVDWSDGSLANPRTDTEVKAIVDVTANFAIETFTVTSSVDGAGGDITPLGDQQVDWSQTAEFALTPADGYLLDEVAGTCGGSLDGLTFTTNPITDNCTVVAYFKLKPDFMFNNGFEEPPRLVFISSVAYAGGLDGLDGADLKCNTLAAAAGLPGTYAAWLSTRTPAVYAKDRVGDHTWVRLDGAVVADNLADLIDNSIQNPINIDEHGANVGSSDVWTGTGGHGRFDGPPSETCWSGGPGALFGNSAASTNDDWTVVGWVPSCSSQFRIYCFGL